MSNTNKPLGAKQVSSGPQNNLRKITLKADYAGKDGDTMYLGSDGYPTITRNSTYPILGAQQGGIIDKDTLEKNTTAGAGDFCMVSDPTMIHEAQLTTGAITDPHTTQGSAAAGAFDIAGSSGVQYIDAAASTYDECLILGPAAHDDPKSGVFSEYDSYQKVKFIYNPAKIVRTVSNYYQAK